MTDSVVVEQTLYNMCLFYIGRRPGRTALAKLMYLVQTEYVSRTGGKLFDEEFKKKDGNLSLESIEENYSGRISSLNYQEGLRFPERRVLNAVLRRHAEELKRDPKNMEETSVGTLSVRE